MSKWLLFLFAIPCLALLGEEDAFAKVYFEDGFWLEGGGNEVKISGYIHADTRSFLRHSTSDSTFLIRRARLIFEGTIQDDFDFEFVTNWRTNHVNLQRAWVELNKPQWAKLRLGLFKEPFSMEELRSIQKIDFTDRSVGVINFSPATDLGAMLYGTLWDEKFTYYLGVFNGRDLEIDNNSKKEYVGRVLFAPFLNSRSIWQSTYFGVAAAISHQREYFNSSDSFVTGNETEFWQWENDVKWNDTRYIWGADFEWYYGSASIKAECLWTDWGILQKNCHSAHFWAKAAYIEATYVLTGEKKIRDEFVKPFHPFRLCKCGYGAWEIAVRYEVLFLSNDPLRQHLAQGTSRLDGYVLGLNGYLNDYTLIRIDWYNYNFKDPLIKHNRRIHGENVINMRAALIF